jgi:outer membrane lipoprotein-sorting protein
MRRIITIVLVTAWCSSAFALTGQEILTRAMDLHASIKDYVADVVVTVDMPEVQVPRRTAKVYFKQPDQVAIDSRGIVMIPKEALVMSRLGSELSKNSTVTLIGTKTVAGHPVYTLKLIEKTKAPSNDRVLVWIRGDRYTVERMEMHSGGRLALAVDWTYQLLQSKYWLPHKLVAKMTSAGGRSDSGQRQGTVTVQFNNMRVNVGLKDDVFKEKKK